MSNRLVQATAQTVERVAAYEDATPPRQPTPMPRQVLTFWTPRRMLASSLGGLKQLRRPPRAIQRATVIANVDDPR
jgi:hypothetical protein